jgi:DNA-binding transcriptional MerR regulator
MLSGDEIMKYYTIYEFAQMANKTPQTLRNPDKRGVLIPHHKGMNGYRYYCKELASDD